MQMSSCAMFSLGGGLGYGGRGFQVTVSHESNKYDP